MKRLLLIAFLCIDLGLIGGTSYFLYAYVRQHAPTTPAAPNPTIPAALPRVPPIASTAPTTNSTGTFKPAIAPTATPGLITPDSSQRKILFTYRNSKPKQVSIRADFTGWKATPMVKAANGSWTYQVSLTPGEYAYCFTADDKTFKDPANPRTKLIGRTIVSAIVVEALSPKTPK